MNCIFCKKPPFYAWVGSDCHKFVCVDCINFYDMAGEDDHKFCYFSYDVLGDDIYWMSLIFSFGKQVILNWQEPSIIIQNHWGKHLLEINETPYIFETQKEWQDHIKLLLTFQ